MFEYFVSEKFMGVFRTYWPVATLFLAFVVYSWKRVRDKANLKVLLGHELFTNVAHIYACLPDKIPEEGEKEELVHEILDSVRTLASSSRMFSFDVYEKYINTLTILSRKEKIVVFTAYYNLRMITRLGKEISELLGINQRTDSQSSQFVQKSVILWNLVVHSIPNLKAALAIFGHKETAIEILQANRGKGLEAMRSLQGSSRIERESQSE